MLKKIRRASLRARALGRLARSSKSALLLSAISLASLQTSPLSAQTWDGGGANNNWNTAGNWAGDVLPVSGAANLTITMAGSTQTSNNQNLANPFQLQSLVLSTGSSSFNISGSPLEFKNLGAAPTIINNSNNTLQVNSNIILTNNLTLTQAGAGSMYFAGVISGTSGISVNGSSNFSGSASNTYTGLTTVEAGKSLTLSKSTGAIAIAGNLSIAGDVYLNSSDEQIANTSTVTMNSGNLYIGNLTETIAALQFTGGYVSSGTFGKLIVNGNIDTNASVSTANIYGNLDLGSSVRTVTVADGTAFNDLEIGAAITSAGLIKAGAGRLNLSAASNTWTGSVTVNAGTLAGNSGNLNTSIVNNSNLEFNQSSDGTFAQTITGTGTLTKTNSGKLTLTGTSAGSATTINDGTLALGASSRLASTSSMTINSGTFDLATFNQTLGTVTLVNGNITGSGTLTASALDFRSGTVNANLAGTAALVKTTSNTVTLTGTNTFTGGTTISAGTLQVSNLTGNVVNNASFTFSNPTDTTYTGNISGTGLFTKNDVGVQTLSGTNTYAGTTTVSAGTLKLGSATALPVNTPLTLNGTGTLDLNGFDATVRNFNGENTTSIALGSGQLTFNNTNSSYQGSVSGSGGITLNGNSLNLTNASYTGATNILIGGAFTTNSLSATANVLNNGSLSYNVNTDRTLAGNISGTGYFDKNGSAVLTLSGTNTYSGSTQVYGGTIKLGSSTALPANGSIYLGSNTTLDLNGYNASFNSFSGEATSAVTLGTGQLTLNSSYISYSGSISGAGGLSINGYSVTLTNASYTGTTIVGSGGSLATNFLVGSIQNNGTVTHNVQTNQTITGNISGTGNFIKNGSGVLTLAGTNTFTGSMNVSVGSLKLASSTGLPTGGYVSMSSNTSLDMNSYNASLSGISGDSSTAITLGGGHLSVGSGGFSGTLSGIGEFTKTGTGSVTLTNASYTGPTNVLGGSLSTNHLSNQASGSVLNNGTLQYNQTADNTLVGNLSGSGSFTKSGNFLLTLSGTNTMTGTMTVSAGTLKIDAAAAIPADAKYSLGNNATLNLNSFAATIATLNGSSSSTLSLGSAAVEIKSGTFQGSINGTGSVTKTGTGNLNLYGSGTYSGGTTLNGGSLQTSGTGRLGSGKLEVTSGSLYLGGAETVSEVKLISGNIYGGTLNAPTYDVRNGTVSANLVGSGSLTKTTADTVNLYGSNSYSGGTTVSAGVLAGAAQAIQGAVLNNALIRFTGSGTSDSVISGSGAVEIDGAYVEYLNNHSYSGGTMVKDGGLTTDPQALPGNTVLQNGYLQFVGSLSPHTYAGNITGTGAVAVNGGIGGVTLSGNNTFDGGLSVYQALTIGSNTALGTGPISLADATLKTAAVAVTVANDVTFAGDTTFGGGQNLSFTQNTQRVLTSSEQLESNNTATVTINGQFIGRVGSLVKVNAGNLVLGDPNHLLGFQTLGDIQIASGATLTVRSSGFADIPALTTLTGGTLAASNGISLGASENIQGYGSVSGKVAAQIGSTIVATGNLSLGNAAHVAGYFSDGELRVNNHQVTIYDKNEIVLGSVTEVGNSSGGGTLIAGAAVSPATNSRLFLLEPGKNVTGHGDVIGNFKNQGSVIGDGTALADRLVFNAGWTVSGKGYFENTLVLGTFAPGESPAIVTGTNQGFGGMLEFELGGLLPGSGPQNHDQVVDNATIMLLANTAISIKPWNNFVPSVGDQFVLMTWQGGLSGSFSNLLIDPVFASNGLGFSLNYNNVGGTGNLTLTTTAVPEPGTLAAGVLGLVAGGVLLRRRRHHK